MIDLLDVLLLMLFATACAWLWRGHGIRERALQVARQHCTKFDVELLDGNVALRRLSMVRDTQGRRRLARIYDFEFTVTGEQRLHGSVQMFGQRPGRVELDAHPFQAEHDDDHKVIRLDDWRRSHPRADEQRKVD